MKPFSQIGVWLLGIILIPPLLGQANASGASSSQDQGVRQWSFAVNITGYIVPNDRSYISPTFTAEHTHLHLEARYNYEDDETGSLWAGYILSFGKTVTCELTPMIGGVFGNTAGVAPGYNLTLGHKRIELFSQSELVVSTKRSSSFLYTWSELSYDAKDWIRAGIVIQRTKAYHTDLNIQRGVLVGVSHKRVSFTTYIFNFAWTRPTIVLSLGLKL